MDFKTLIIIPIDKFKSMFNSLNSVNSGRQLTDKEDIEPRAEVKAFNSDLYKTSKGHVVSPELMPSVKEFEKANYDINKLPSKMKNSLVSTYNDFNQVIAEDPTKYKDTTAELYCSIYELFSSNAIAKAVNRAKKSKVYNQVAASSEMLKGTENWEDYLSSHAQSEEVGLLSGVTAGISATTTAITGISGMLHVLTVLLVFISAAIIVLCVVSTCYNIQLGRNIELLSEQNNVKNMGASKAHELRVKTSMNDMENNIPVISKTLFFKPMIVIKSFISKFFVEKYDDYDKELTRIDNYKSKESLENTDQSQEVAVEAIGAAVTKWFLPVVIALSLPLILKLLRSVMYFIGRLRLKMHDFFEEQSEWVDINVEELIAKRDDPSTSKSEKERLNKIIERQMAWGKNLKSASEKIYKVQTEAGNDARTELRNDDNKNWEKEVRNEKDANKTLPVSDGSEVPDKYNKDIYPENNSGSQSPAPSNK